MGVEAVLIGPVVIRQDDQGGVGAGILAAFMWPMTTRVEFDPQPAITGTRRLAWSTQTEITRACSLGVSVADSPVVPHGTSP